ALPDEFGHAADAFLDRHIRIDARHAKHVERFNAEIFQALFAGPAEITRIAAATEAVGATIARAPTLRADDHFMPAAADRFVDQAVVVALAITRRRVEQIDAEMERAVDCGDRLGIVDRSIDA